MGEIPEKKSKERNRKDKVIEVILESFEVDDDDDHPSRDYFQCSIRTIEGSAILTKEKIVWAP